MARTSDVVKWVTAGVEVAASRRATWVALCGVNSKTKRVHVQVGDPLAGTAVTGQLVALWEEHGLDGFALDPRSPSATLAEPLKAEGMMLRLPDAAQVATAHGMFIDYLNADRLRISGHPAVDEAVFAAERRRLAGQDAVDRYAGGTEMAPLLAAELAVWALGDPDDAEGIEPGVWLVLRGTIGIAPGGRGNQHPASGPGRMLEVDMSDELPPLSYCAFWVGEEVDYSVVPAMAARDMVIDDAAAKREAADFKAIERDRLEDAAMQARRNRTDTSMAGVLSRALVKAEQDDIKAKREDVKAAADCLIGVPVGQVARSVFPAADSELLEWAAQLRSDLSRARVQYGRQAAEVARREPRPFGREVRRSEFCFHCTNEGLSDEQSYLLHSDPEFAVPVSTEEQALAADQAAKAERYGRDDYGQRVISR